MTVHFGRALRHTGHADDHLEGTTDMNEAFLSPLPGLGNSNKATAPAVFTPGSALPPLRG